MWLLQRLGRLVSALSVLLLIVAAVSSSRAHEEAGTTHFVANNGVDGDACGSKLQPCRSIGRAIQQASDGDTILVGPGFYGDTNNDGDFADPGDEFLDASFPGTCLVCVSKQVRVLSTHGAKFTIIDGSGTEAFGPVVGVSIMASGVLFGAESRGFTIRAVSDIGVHIRPEAADVTIAGNHASNNGGDRDTSGIGFSIAVGAGVVRVRANLATNNNLYGFLLADSRVGGSARIVDNVARDNRETAFVIEAGATPGYVLIGNVATSNGRGFSLDGKDLLFRRNIMINNRQGMSIEGDSSSNMLLVDNSIIGNRAGVLIGPDVPGPIDIHRSNIYGNVGGTSTTELNCGIANQAGKIDARNNFWGAPTGPGPDPADQAGRGGGCDDSAEAETLVVPFSTRPFRIQTKPTVQTKSVQDEAIQATTVISEL